MPKRRAGSTPDTAASPAEQQARDLPPLAYSVPETAIVTRLSRATIYNLMRSGRLAYVQVGDRRLIRPSAIEAMLAACERTGDAGAGRAA